MQSVNFAAQMMSRIMAIDYGQKRAGVAVTDELQMIATGLKTVHIKDIWTFLNDYLQKENVETIVVGEPRNMQNRPSDATRFIEPFVGKLRKQFPQVTVDRYDERFTSKIAHETMLTAGLRKQKRQDKALVDTISATLILQSYLESKQY